MCKHSYICAWRFPQRSCADWLHKYQLFVETYCFHPHRSPETQMCRKNLTFRGPCVVIYSYNIYIYISSSSALQPWVGLGLLLRFRNSIFLRGWVVSLTPNPPTWRTRVSLFVWVITLDLSGMWGPTSSICYYQHNSRDHMTTQAPPQRQSRDSFGGIYIYIYIYIYNSIIYSYNKRVMKHYSPTGRRNYGRPLKRLLDTWDRNGSTRGPTPWQIYDYDDDKSQQDAQFLKFIW